jgi:hypothetical protein
MSDRASSLHVTARIDFWRQSLSGGTAVAAVALMALNMFDAFSTLYLISLSQSAEELNPVMRQILIHWGPFGFLAAKYFMVAIGVFVCAAHCHQHREARRVLFYLLLPVYFLVAAYQLFWLVAIN